MTQLENFFESIQIYQMSRHRYTCSLLANHNKFWQHDTMDNSDSGAVLNTMTVQYETVWYARGPVTEGTAPKMFGLQVVIMIVCRQSIISRWWCSKLIWSKVVLFQEHQMYS